MEENTIIIKKSTVLGNAPNINALENGELAINCADGYIFFKKNNGGENYLAKFVDLEGQPYLLDNSLSAIKPQYGGNTVSEVFATVLGGYNNDVGGAASTVVNGENNDIFSDFSTIANGLNNKILSGGDYSFIGGGENNLVSHRNVFTLGSNLSSHAEDFTYVNNISATGKIYGDGSELTGIVGGDTEATTLVRNSSADWTSSYTTVQSNSSDWNSPQIDVVLTSDPLKFVFIGDGSTTSYTVSGTTASTNASLIDVFVDNVRQEPTESYSLSANIVEFVVAPSLNSRIFVITPNTVAGQLSVAKRHEFIDEDTYSISYAAIASFGTPEISSLWRITKITYTNFGSVSATQYANDVAWTNRLIVSYS